MSKRNPFPDYYSDSVPDYEGKVYVDGEVASQPSSVPKREVTTQPKADLLTSRQVRARQLKREIETHMNTIDSNVVSMASKLQEVYRDELWRDMGYKSFSEFCRESLSISRRRAYQIITAEDHRSFLAAAFTDDPRMLEIVKGLSHSALDESSKSPETAPTDLQKASEGSDAPPSKKRIKQQRPEKQAKAKVIHRCPHCNGEL